LSIALRCPECSSPIELATEPTCADGHTFKATDGIVDFIGARPYDANLPVDHCGEAAGLRARVQNYILPWLEKMGSPAALTVLDDGCGNGEAVKNLVDCGVDAYGIDAGQRSSQWAVHNIPDRLFIADGTKLPFSDQTFDGVISSGVIEHIGEGVAADRRGQDPYKQRYIDEIIRVLKPGGRALVAAPNGAFPIDFWHPVWHGMRLHRPYETWLPNAFATRRWVRNSPVPTAVRFLPPGGFLAFQRVREYWYGRAFGRAVQTALSMIDRFPALSPSVANPVLIAELRRL
jgi:SAM-dependent methyltransferase